jgi:hypothetical protein
MWLTPPARCAAQAPDKPPASPLGLPQHPDEHRPERPVVLLAVDEEFGEGAALRVVELAYRAGTLEAGSPKA